MKNIILKITIFLLFIFLPVIFTLTYIITPNDRLEDFIIFILLALVSILIFIVGLLLFVFTKKRMPLYFGIYVVVLIISSYFIRSGFINYEDNKTMNDAQTIINAIDKYNAMNRHYPNTIEDLKPNFMKVIPKRFHCFRSETEFEYGFEEIGVYYIAYDVDERCPMYYYSDTKRWFPRPKG